MKMLLIVVGASCTLYACTQANAPYPVTDPMENTAAEKPSPLEPFATDSSHDSASIPTYTIPPPPKIYDCCWLEEKESEYEDLELDCEHDYSQAEELDASIEYYTNLKPAHFPGGNEMLPAYLKEHLHYPAELKAQEIEGSVYVEFTIAISGKIHGVQIRRGFTPQTDSICAQVFRQMPIWTPAMKDGKVISTSYLIPIKFKPKRDAIHEKDSSWKLRPILPSYYSLISELDETKTPDSGQNLAPEIDELTLELYPNPATNYCHVSVSPYRADLEYTVFNSASQILMQGKLLSSKQKIELQHLATGNYFLMVYSHESGLKTSTQFSVQ